jgi:type III secretion system-like peptide-binding chaperone
MTRDERLALISRDLDALSRADDGFVIFNPPHDEDTYVQFSHRSGEPIFCEVSNRSEGWNAHSLDLAQIAELRALGYDIPSPHHQANPNKEFAGEVSELAREIERIFRNVFREPEDYSVVSKGVET